MKPSKLTWENMEVSSVFLGHEERGMLTGWVHLAANSGAQGFGGRYLDTPEGLMAWVKGILAVVGPFQNRGPSRGTYLRVGRETPYGPIRAIRPIIDDYPVFMPTDEPGDDWLWDLEREHATSTDPTPDPPETEDQ